MSRLIKFDNYDDYVKVQTAANKAKIGRVFVEEEEIADIVAYVKSHMSSLSMALCHGVRNGYEVKVFRKCLGIKVVGTDISPTATQFENVIQWDFHDVKKEWLGSCDFVYSNSLDHAFDPPRALWSWIQCLNGQGRCFVEWSAFDAQTKGRSDCFGANRDEYAELIEKVGVLEAMIEHDVQDLGQNRVTFVVRSSHERSSATVAQSPRR